MASISKLSESQLQQYYESRLHGQLRRSGSEYTARCPFHPDDNPSLSVSFAKGLWHCFVCNIGGGILDFEMRHSSCDKPTARKRIEEVLGVKLGLSSNQHKEPEAIYNYTDPFGSLLFQVVRYPGKQFRQRKPSAKGGWDWRTSDIPMTLYHLPDVATARNIIVVEGERDADNLKTALGDMEDIAATTAPRGAGKWQDGFSKYLAGKQVLILPDNDEAGRKHADAVAMSAYKYTPQVKILALPGLPDHGDVSDYLETHSAAEILALAQNTPQWRPPVSEEVPHLTDLGNAERLEARHGRDMRFCGGDWLVWDSRRFARDETGESVRRAADVALSIYDEIKPTMSPEAQKELLAHAKASESAGRISSMLTMAQSSVGLSITPAELDRDPMLLNVGNGTIDLRTGELHQHSRENLLTKLTPVDYSSDARCPVFEKFLDRVMDGNAEMVAFLQRSIGYSLTGDTREQCFFILHGCGSNGKSTLVEVILALLGEYAKAADSSLLLAKQGDGIRNDVAALAGSRYVTASETEAGRKLAESLVKSLTGSDSVTARFLYHEFFTFVMQAKLWLSTNHKPHIRGTDGAIWRRVRLVPFRAVIPASEQDRQLPAKLRAELPGILRWAVEGCLAWQQDGLGTPAEVKEATESYRQEQDIFGAFLDDCCKIGSGPEFEAPTAHLREKYTEWCAQNGHKANPTFLWSQLTDRGFHKDRDKHSRRRLGLRLLTLAEQEVLESQPPEKQGTKNTVTTVTNPPKPQENKQLELGTATDRTTVTHTDTARSPNSKSNQQHNSGDSAGDSATVPAKPLETKASDSDDSEECISVSPRAVRSSGNGRMTGLRVLQLIREAGGSPVLIDGDTIKPQLPGSLPEETREYLFGLLTDFDKEVMHILRARTTRL